MTNQTPYDELLIVEQAKQGAVNAQKVIKFLQTAKNNKIADSVIDEVGAIVVGYLLENTPGQDKQDSIDQENVSTNHKAYWDAIWENVVSPFLKPGTAYGDRMFDKNIGFADVCEYIYNKMVVKGKLRDLRSRRYVLSFIIEYVQAYIRRKCEYRSVQEDESLSIESLPGGVEHLLTVEEDDFEDTQLQYNYAYLRESFDILWQKNPRKAVAYLLKYVNNLSAREIKLFMGLASENYVYQVLHDTTEDMKKLYMSVEETLGQLRIFRISELIDRLGSNHSLAQMLAENNNHLKKYLSRKTKAFARETGMSDEDIQELQESIQYIGKAFCIKFRSDFSKTNEKYWVAKVVIGDLSADSKSKNIIYEDSMLPVSVRGKAAKLIPEGVLDIFDTSLIVSEGKANCKMDDMQKNLTSNKVSLETPDHGVVPGHLSF